MYVYGGRGVERLGLHVVYYKYTHKNNDLRNMYVRSVIS